MVAVAVVAMVAVVVALVVVVGGAARFLLSRHTTSQVMGAELAIERHQTDMVHGFWVPYPGTTLPFINEHGISFW